MSEWSVASMQWGLDSWKGGWRYLRGVLIPEAADVARTPISRKCAEGAFFCAWNRRSLAETRDGLRRAVRPDGELAASNDCAPLV